jgi:hypothetical protein
MSAGILTTGAARAGAVTGLKKRPVTFERKKSEKMATGANFAERK